MKKYGELKRLMTLLLLVSLLSVSGITYAGTDGDVQSVQEISISIEAQQTIERLKEVEEIEDAFQVIEKADFEEITDDAVYDLMSITYEKPNWEKKQLPYTLNNLRILIVQKGSWENKYYKIQVIDPKARMKEYKLSVIWPPDNGFKNGISDAKVLKAGTIIDRYGYPGGRFLAPSDSPYKTRAVAPGTKETSPYYQYEVVKDILVDAGTVEPWFGVIGNGQQYYLGPLTVQDYIDNGFLKVVPKKEGTHEE